MKSPDRDAADELVKPCTCHPDDNPPVPCAQKYALTDCRASELATLRRRVEWQPPATARKDEYAIICDARGERWLAAYYPDNNGANWRGPNSEVYEDVIGWMPLPAAISPPTRKE